MCVHPRQGGQVPSSSALAEAPGKRGYPHLTEVGNGLPESQLSTLSL